MAQARGTLFISHTAGDVLAAAVVGVVREVAQQRDWPVRDYTQPTPGEWTTEPPNESAACVVIGGWPNQWERPSGHPELTRR